MADQGYAGDLPPDAAFRLLQEEPKAQLIDVRTDAEWAYVGLPDLGQAGKEPLRLAWQLFPAMAVNPAFVGTLAGAIHDRDTPLLFLCRSGVRSKAAAMAMTAAGFTRCYNIAEGFEGAPAAERHRGRVNGWKARGLPWQQG